MQENKFNTIGSRIKLIRKKLFLQQKDVAAAIGVSSSHLSEIESGKSSANADFILKLSVRYNVSVEYIFHGRGEIFYQDESKLTDDPFDFNGAVNSISDFNWLVKHSSYVRISAMAFVSKLLLTEEAEIKRSITKTKHSEIG